MEFRVILFLVGFASSVFGELSGDQQNSFNYQPNEGQNQQGFGQNVYGSKISQVETKPAVNHGDLQKTRVPTSSNGIPFPTPFYGHFQPMQQLQGSSHPEDASETQSPLALQPQKPSSTLETYNHLALPAPYPYPYPGFTPTTSTFAPYPAYGSNSVQGSKVTQPQNQNGNVLTKPGENTNSFSSPVTYSYPVPVPMPFPSYFPYPQMQYPH